MGRRRLTPVERGEAEAVFGDGLDYDRVWLVEGVTWPNWIARLTSPITRSPPTGSGNAVTLGNRVHFPVQLRTREAEIAQGILADMAWLIHELTHVWQSQRDGPVYLAQAILAHLRLGSQVYDYGGAAGLLAAKQRGEGFRSFNREQQGDIARDYYLRRKRNQDTSAWDPMIAELGAVTR